MHDNHRQYRRYTRHEVQKCIYSNPIFYTSDQQLGQWLKDREQNSGAAPGLGIWTGHSLTAHESSLFNFPICMIKSHQQLEGMSQTSTCDSLM